ncbi:hypothetical protein CsSME_00001165 [Camellia sinensis var. sinensis]
MRDFFQERKDKGKKVHLVNWEAISFPKENGGLAIGNIVARNTALLGNWFCFIYVRVGNGKIAKFWEDVWVGGWAIGGSFGQGALTLCYLCNFLDHLVGEKWACF